MTLVIREAEVRAALADLPAAVDAVEAGVREAGRAKAERAHRVNLALPGGWLRLMGGALPESDLLGFKAFHLVPEGVRYLCGVYRLSTGEPLALVDANELTVIRTGAAAAAAARRFFGATGIAVGVFGTGTLARSGLRILASVCNVDSVRVFSPRAESRSSFADELGVELGLPLVTVSTGQDVAEGADILLCCTDTRGRVAVGSDFLGTVRYVSSVGSTLPSQRELAAAVAGAAELLIVDSAHALEESGDLIAAAEAGLLTGSIVSLADFLETEPLSGSTPGLTVYKSVGSFEQDLALASFVLHACEQRGLGEEIVAVESLRR